MVGDTVVSGRRPVLTKRRAWAVVLGAITFLAGWATVAWASHSDPYIDLASAPNLDVTHDGARFIQGGIGAGTGNFDPFVTANPGGSTSPESAINICDDPGCPSPEFDTFTGGGRTHEILLSAIPEIELDGVVYREFSLDANDQGADDFMSIDDIQIFLDTQNDATGFDPAAMTFGSDSDPTAVKVYDLDVPVLMRSQTFTPGSGVSDITLLVPTSFFDTVTTDCAYGSLTCEHYLYFYFMAGGYDGSVVPAGLESADWDVTSGFEEWRTRLLPVVNVAKTADTSLTRTYTWDVEKQVSTDGGSTFADAGTLDLFDGDSADVEWKITWDRSAGVDSDQQVSGTISVVNPTGGAVIDKDIPATLNSVEDIVPGGTAIVDCGVTFPYVLGAGDTLVCTYTAATDGTNGDNVATANIDDGLGGTSDYSGTAPVDFATATVTEVDEDATLTDIRNAIDQLVSDDGMTSYTEEFSCGDNEGVHENTATITPNDGGAVDEDTATLTVNCYELTVTKDADTSLTRTYDWAVEKVVSKDGGATYADSQTLDLFNGDSAEVKWLITWDRDDGTDSDFAVDGTIRIDNPAPIDAEGVEVSDMVPGGTAVITCDGVEGDTIVDVSANSFVECSYEASTDGSNGDNVATATLFGIGYQGTAAVDFSDAVATVNEVDEAAVLTDIRNAINQLADPPDDGMVMYTETLECDRDDGNNPNTATITTNDTGTVVEDMADVTVNCYELTVTKDANTSFDRDWDWTIDKTGSTDSVTLNFGETADVGYDVTVNATKTDSNFAVNGTITITNDAPVDALGVEVSDMVPGGTAVITCDGVQGDTTVDVPAGMSVDCTYTASTDGSDGTNTATATLFGIGYDGIAPVDFSMADINETDASVDVEDSLQGFLGTVEAPTPAGGVTFSYTRTIESTIQGCGDTSIPNIATLATDDGQVLMDNWNVDVTVICTRSQLTPTGTECFDFANETAQDQEELLYKKGLAPGQAIQSVTPGAFIYWAEIIHEGGSFQVDVLQSTDFTPIAVASDGAKLFNADCLRVTATTSVSGGDATISVANLPAGTYYVTVKYNSSSLKGEMPAGASFEYTWETSLNGGPVFNGDSLTLRPS